MGLISTIRSLIVKHDDYLTVDLLGRTLKTFFYALCLLLTGAKQPHANDLTLAVVHRKRHKAAIVADLVFRSEHRLP